MGFRKTILLLIGLSLFWLLSNTLFKDNLGSSIRYFNDDGDWKDYAADASYYLHGQVPYRDTLSEYPQIPTYLFAVPYLLFQAPPGEALNFQLYSAFFTLMMVAVLCGTIILLYRMLPSHKNRAFLLLLPAPLYFSYNRFDILPSFLVLLSLFLLQQKKSVWVGIVLGIATLTKWYPALLLPIYLSYIFHSQHRFDWRMLLAFCLACLAILAPTFALGGLKAVLVPYLFHAERGFEYVALPTILKVVPLIWFNFQVNPDFLKNIFLILSILPLPLSVFAQVDTYEKVVYWSVIAIAFFIIFSRIWSPQWILWVLPLAILVSQTPPDIAWIVAYGLVDYAAFPILFNLLGTISWPLIFLSLAMFIILFHFALVSFQHVRVKRLLV